MGLSTILERDAKVLFCSGGAAKHASASCLKRARRLSGKEPSGPSCSVPLSCCLQVSLFRLSPFWIVCTRPEKTGSRKREQPVQRDGGARVAGWGGGQVGMETNRNEASLRPGPNP